MSFSLSTPLPFSSTPPTYTTNYHIPPYSTTPLTVPIPNFTSGYIPQPVVTTTVYPPPPPYPPPPFGFSAITSPLYNGPYSSPLTPYPPYFNHSYSPQYNTPNSYPPFRNPKVEMGNFDGSEVLDWLFQAEQFFVFYNIPPDSRLQMAAFYMKGEALSWYK